MNITTMNASRSFCGYSMTSAFRYLQKIKHRVVKLMLIIDCHCFREYLKMYADYDGYHI